VEASIEELRIAQRPLALPAILRDTEALGFTLASDPRTGSLLRTLAASKPGGRLLELGTGTGVGTAWLLEGMDARARLETVDEDEAAVAVARKHLGRDARVAFHVMEGAEFLRAQVGQRYDLIFADTWPGKFSDLEAALSLLPPGGLYVIDDLLPQPSWPDGHGVKVPPLIAALESHADLSCTRLAWATGIMIVAKRA
jgi:predicted O-methyltransferase YrrM